MQVFVTPRAEKNFNLIIEYIEQAWGEKTAKEFIQKTDDIFKLLSSYLLMGQVEKDDIRGFQLSPQTKILYRMKVIVLAFLDVRQNPNKKFE